MPTIEHIGGAVSVEERLERLEAAEAARRLLARYARACDRQDADAVVALFAPDGEIEIPGTVYNGVTEIKVFYQQAFTDDPSIKSHIITNTETAWRGGGLIAIDAYLLYTAAGDASSVLGWGEYHAIVRVGAEAAIQRLTISIRRAVDVRQGWARTAEEPV